jgi:hypothetical protein
VKKFFWWDWALNSGLCTFEASAVPLEPHTFVHFALVVLEMGEGVFQELFAWAGLKL